MQDVNLLESKNHAHKVHVDVHRWALVKQGKETENCYPLKSGN